MPQDNRTAHVSNFPFSTTEADLLAFFGDFSPVKARVIVDRETRAQLKYRNR